MVYFLFAGAMMVGLSGSGEWLQRVATLAIGATGAVAATAGLALGRWRRRCRGLESVAGLREGLLQ